jgi:hypothetical protein
MGILSPDPSREGYFNVGKKKELPVAVATPAQAAVWRACDHCGYSTDNQPIARAYFQVEVIAGTLYFCAHHFRRHAGHAFERGYRVIELVRAAVTPGPVYL